MRVSQSKLLWEVSKNNHAIPRMASYFSVIALQQHPVLCQQRNANEFIHIF